LGIDAIELTGSLIIVGYVVAALWLVARRQGFARARLTVAQGALYGLAFKVAATLLKTIVLHSLDAIAIFAAVFALRTLIKRVFAWERGRLLLN